MSMMSYQNDSPVLRMLHYLMYEIRVYKYCCLVQAQHTLTIMHDDDDIDDATGGRWSAERTDDNILASDKNFYYQAQVSRYHSSLITHISPLTTDNFLFPDFTALDRWKSSDVPLLHLLFTSE